MYQQRQSNSQTYLGFQEEPFKENDFIYDEDNLNEQRKALFSLKQAERNKNSNYSFQSDYTGTISATLKVKNSSFVNLNKNFDK